MSYAGEYDPAPVPQPKKKPEMRVELVCGEKVWTKDAWWMSDPLYGGWKTPAYAWCEKHQKSESVKGEVWPPERKT